MDTGKLLGHTSEIWKKFESHIGNYLNSKENIPVPNAMELLGDLFQVIGFAKKATSIIMQKRYEAFLKGFSSETDPTEKQLERLIEYVNDETKAEFIADTISKVLFTQSKKACTIMGSILNSIVNTKEELSHEQLVCFEALANFSDTDIDNYRVIHEFFLHTSQKQLFFNDWTYRTYFEKAGKSEVSVLMTLEKSVVNNIIIKTPELGQLLNELDSTIENLEIDVRYRLTPPGELLYSLMNRCKV
ncbi:hypothetical protein EBB07_03585 [Paenibacillaceae bacterium]|nr:hypothetical protein EBB07_03585 [Paenibacillaceae bacterium]